MKTSDAAVITLLVCVIVIMAVFYYQLKHDDFNASTKPYSYSLEKLSDKYHEDISCTCLGNKGGNYILNETGAWREGWG